MDKVMEYRKVLIRFMQNHSDLLNNSATENVQTQTIFDEARDQYMLFRAGWQNKQRIHIPFLYVQFPERIEPRMDGSHQFVAAN